MTSEASKDGNGVILLAVRFRPPNADPSRKPG